MLKTFSVYVPLTILCVASFQYRVFVGYSSFHSDESTWLASTEALSLVLAHDFDNPFWKSYLGRTQPHAGHYVYGMVLLAAGYPIGQELIPDRYDWRHDLRWNAQHHRLPSAEVLLTARRFSAFCGALACLLLCEIGRRTFGWTVGLVAAIWLAANPLMRFVSQRAMIDGQITLALVAGILCLQWLFRIWQSGKAKNILLAAVPTGLLCGLAVSLKLNGGVLCLIALGALGCFIIQVFVEKNKASRPPRPLVKAILAPSMSVVLLCTIALTTFYTLNPQFWPQGLVSGINDTIALRSRTVRSQQLANPELAASSLSRNMRTGFSNYFRKWPTLRTRPIRDFVSAQEAGEDQSGLTYIEFSLFCIGIIVLFGKIVFRLRREHVVDPACVLGVWFLAYSAFVFFLVPLDWPRYYQKFLPIQAMLAGISVHWFIDRR